MSAFAPTDPEDSYIEADPAETSTPPISHEAGNDEPTQSRGHSNNPLLGSDNSLVSDLEQEVLEEYTRLLRNVNQVREDLHNCSQLRGVVFTRKPVEDETRNHLPITDILKQF